MKIPSFFRLPRHQRFEIQPRYYDPIKDEIEQKRQRIRSHLKWNEENGIKSEYQSGGRLEGAFHRRAPVKDNITFLRLGLAAILFGGVVGYLYFGDYAIYATLGLAVTYLVIRKLGIF